MISLIGVISFISYTNLWRTISPYTSLMSLIFSSLLRATRFHIISHPFLRIDFIAIRLILLSGWILGFTFISRWSRKAYNNRPLKFSIINITLITLLIISFTIRNILIFYILFEASLIPITMLIINWGYQPERRKARIFMLIYTISASLPLLIRLLIHFNILPTFWSPHHIALPSSLITISISLAFLVKLPIYGLHLWLPKAHTEAPVAGSIVLARIILKLGRYGLIRIYSTIPTLLNKLQTPIITITLFGAATTALLCLRQHDLKEAVAYASVRHIRLIACALFTKSHWAFRARILINIGHGITRAIIFSIVNTLYENSNSRTMSLNKGTMSIIPVTALFFFIAILRNGGAPPFVSLLREIIIFIPIIYINIYLALSLFIMSFLSIVYSIFIFISTHHGKPINSKRKINNNFTLLSSAIFHRLLLRPSILIAQYIVIWETSLIKTWPWRS